MIKFDGETGDELWRQILNGTLNDDDEAFAVLVDAAGNIIAAGTTRNTDTGRDFTLVKFRGIDGGDFVPRTTLALSPRVVRAGDRITATWNGIATPTAKDWIGLYLPGTAQYQVHCLDLCQLLQETATRGREAPAPWLCPRI